LNNNEIDTEPDDWIEPGWDDPVTSEEFFDSVAAEILGQPKKVVPYTKEMLAEDKKLVSWDDRPSTDNSGANNS